MEPSAKRLRILQSVEVDETNADYVAAKQKQQKKFKGRLESLFAKYEGMHESMSDEIDFKTGKVVVDRGHLRRVQRQLKRKEPTLLDSLLERETEKDDTPEKEQEQAESEDELAPTQVPKRNGDKIGDRMEDAQPSEQYGTGLDTTPSHTVPIGLVQENALQIPNTSNPAASLLQHVQFPQSPLGQQAQAAFYANLNQTIAQAVQQAVAPLLSSVFKTTPNVHNAQAPTFTVPSPHLSATDNVRPASDPKWYFPPMSNTKAAQRIQYQRSSPPVLKKALPETSNRDEASSPLVSCRRSPMVRIQRSQNISKTKRSTQLLRASVERPQSSQSLPASCSNVNSFVGTDLPIDDLLSSRVKKPKSTQKKYHFTEEEEVYISKNRELHNRSFKEIKASKEKWSSWPLSAFYNHWNNHLKDTQLHRRDTPKVESSVKHVSPTPSGHEEQFFSSKEIPETSSAPHHLPTPSSLRQDDSFVDRVAMPSSSHFDDDELELLSLAGADISDSLPTCDAYANSDAYPTPDEILPSIEGAEFRNEDELQLEMLKTEDSEDEEPMPPKVFPSTVPESQDSVVVISSPSRKHKADPKSKSKPKPKLVPIHHAMSDSDDDLDLVGAGDVPTTPGIKRESLTPQASRFLCSSPAFKTPKPALQHSSSLAPTATKSTGKLDRRAFLKEVKQSWAENKVRGKRRSLNVLPTPRKRIWAEMGDSEDELAG